MVNQRDEAQGPFVRRRLVAALVALVLTVLAAWPYLSRLPHFGRLQNNDYYGILATLLDAERDDLTTDPGRWLRARSNEHRATVAALIYAGNASLFAGNNRTLSAFTILLLAGTSLVLQAGIPQAARGNRLLAPLAWAVVAVFTFTPVAVHNVAMGFSGTQWLLANFLVITAMAVLVRRAASGRVAPLWPIAALALVGTFTYSTTLTGWLALFLGALMLRLRRMQLLFVGLTAALPLALFALSHQPQPHHVQPAGRNLGTIWVYVTTYLGSSFSKLPEAAFAFGLVGALAAGTVLTATLQRRHAGSTRVTAEIVLWIMVGGHGLLAGLSTALGRGGFGTDQALASRYGTLHAFFWMAVIVLTIELTARVEAPGRRRALAVWAAITALTAMVLLYQRGAPLLESFVGRSDGQRMAEFAMYYGLQDEATLRTWVTPRPDQVAALTPFMQKHGHIPFDAPRRQLPAGSADLGEVREIASIGQGFLDGAQALQPGIVSLRGWAFSPEAALEEVVLRASCRADLVAHAGHRRRDVIRHVGAEGRRAGFTAFARLPEDCAEIEAFARFAGFPDYYRLQKPDGFDEAWRRALHPVEDEAR